MNGPTKINGFQAFTLFLLWQSSFQFLVLFPLILEAAKRDAWISILISLLLCLLISPIIIRITKVRGVQRLPSWIGQRSRMLKGIMIGIIQLYLFLTAYIVCQQLITYTKIVYLQQTPLIFLLLPLLLLVFLAAKSGIQTIAVFSGILYPLMFLFQMIMMFGNIPYLNFGMMTPVFENGMTDIWTGLPWSISGFLDLMFFWVLLSHLSEKTHNKIYGGVLIFSGTVFLLAVTASVLIFGPFEAATQRFPIFEQWRLVMISKYVEHVDFLSMFLRLSASMMRSVLCLYLSAEMFRWAKTSGRTWYLAGACVLLFILLFIPESDPHFLTMSKKVYIPFIIFSSLAVFITLWLISFRGKENRRRMK